jgi:hypothetical protein
VPPINIKDYPALKAHLDQYWSKLEKRSDQGVTPYNLRNCAYMDDFSKQKVIWKRIGSILRFGYDEHGSFGLDSTCLMTGENIQYLTVALNSPLGHFQLQNAPRTGTGDLIISVQAFDTVAFSKSANSNIYMELVAAIQSGNSDEIIDLEEISLNDYEFSRLEKDFLRKFSQN